MPLREQRTPNGETNELPLKFQEEIILLGHQGSGGH